MPRSVRQRTPLMCAAAQTAASWRPRLGRFSSGEIALTGTKRTGATNRLLDKLPRADRERFLEGCQPVELERGKVLAVPGNVLRHVFFPTDSFISLTTRMGRTAS